MTHKYYCATGGHNPDHAILPINPDQFQQFFDVRTAKIDQNESTGERTTMTANHQRNDQMASGQTSANQVESGQNSVDNTNQNMPGERSSAPGNTQATRQDLVKDLTSHSGVWVTDNGKIENRWDDGTQIAQPILDFLHEKYGQDLLLIPDQQNSNQKSSNQQASNQQTSNQQASNQPICPEHKSVLEMVTT